VEVLYGLAFGVFLIVLFGWLIAKIQTNRDHTLIQGMAPGDFGARKRKKFSRKGLRSKDVTLETLKSLIPIRSIDERILALIHKKSEPKKSGFVLFDEGDSDNSILFLLDGVVGIEFVEGGGYRVEAGSAISRFPLSVGPIHKYRAVAKTDVHILRVPSQLTSMSTCEKSVYRSSKEVARLKIPAELKLSGLVHTFCQHVANDELQLPSFPDVALKLRQAIRKDVSVADAVKIIQMDPSIAAKLIQVANSPFYMTEIPAIHCKEAVNRIGLIATREIVTSICLHQVFQAKHPRIKKFLADLWQSSIGLSSLCYVLASKTTRIDPDQALLAGLMCDIGIIPFLTFAEGFPDELFESDELDKAIPYLRGPIGSLVLKRWKFPQEMVKIPVMAEEWFHDSGPQLTICDIVRLAKLHSYIGSKRQSELPPINTIPAYSKLDNVRLSPELSLALLNDAQEQVGAVKSFF